MSTNQLAPVDASAVASAVAPSPQDLSTLREPLEVLRAARALIEKPENWTKEAYARDALGEKCADSMPHAYSFCMLGAMWRVGESTSLVARAATAVSRAVGLTESLDTFNDTHTHAEVLAAFDRAIASLTGEAS